MSRVRAATWYVIALTLVAAAWLARWLLEPLLGAHMPFATFFVAVATTAWLGGNGPIALETLLAGVAP